MEMATWNVIGFLRPRKQLLSSQPLLKMITWEAKGALSFFVILNGVIYAVKGSEIHMAWDILLGLTLFSLLFLS